MTISEVAAPGRRLSPAQRRLWLAAEGAGVPLAHCAVLVEGALRAAELRAAVERTVARHDILRTTFRRRPGMKVPLQVAVAASGFGWREIDLTAGGAAPDAALAAAVGRFPGELDLENGPVLHLELLRLAADRHLLVLVLPALAADRCGLVALSDEIRAAYDAGSGSGSGSGETDAEPVQYSGYSEWLYDILATEDDDQKRGRAHWQRQEPAGRQGLLLPGSRPRQGGAPPAAARRCAVELAPELGAALAAVAGRLAVGRAALLLAAWQLVLGRLSGEPQVTVGVVFDGRKYQELAGTIGLLARVLPLTAALGGNPRFCDLLAKIDETWRRAGEWQEYAPWEEPGAAPAIAAGFELLAWPPPRPAGGAVWTPLAVESDCELPDLKLLCRETGAALTLELRYRPDVLPAHEAQLLARRLAVLLGAVARAPEERAAWLPMLPAAERHRLLAEVNDSAFAAAPWPGVAQRFARQAALTPESPAVVYEDRRLSYRQLDQAAERLAATLCRLGVRPEDRVGLLVERSAAMVVALLAVLKASAAYVPLDPAAPLPRSRMMLADAGAVAVVASPGLPAADLVAAERIVWLPPEAGRAGIREGVEEEPRGPLAAAAPTAPHAAERDGTADPARLAYVLFTSGSTGRPKGVAIEHRQLLNYVDGVLSRLDMPAGGSFAMVSTFAADLGNTMLFPALLSGGCLHVISTACAADPEAFAAYCRRHAIDCLKIVPSHLEALLGGSRPEDVLPRRLLVLGGEAASAALRDRLAAAPAGCRIFNHYGPTEATVGATAGEVTRAALAAGGAGTLPIGRPLANARTFLLDGWMQTVAAGGVGELYLGGAGLARGYLGRPDLTAERFVPAPVGGEPGARLYRTGDLVRLLPDDRLEFLGRADDQVKIHGFRVETREIEEVLGGHPQVRAAAVRVRADAAGQRRLVAWVVPRPGGDLAAESLRTWLGARLPSYMVPSDAVLLAALPLTANGKLDVRALPAPEQAAAGSRYAAPRTAVEERLAAIWQKVLGVDRVGRDDNFFDLRGDSILAIQMIAAANREGLVLQPKDLFDHPTVGRLAAVVGSGPRAVAEQGLVTGPVPLTPIQQWFFALGLAVPGHWNQSTLWELGEAPPPVLLARAVERLVTHHDALRLRFEPAADGWRQSCAGAAAARGVFTAVDLTALPAPRLAAAREAAMAAVQSSLDLTRGPLLRVVLLRGAAASPALLLLAVHHLAIDGFSWRILLEDLTAALLQIGRGQELRLPEKTSSWRQWAERLQDHAASARLAAELDFWLAAAAPAAAAAWPPAASGDADTLAGERSLVVTLEEEETRFLLAEVPAVYRTRIDDVLLTAVARGCRRQTGQPSLLVELEGHGREPLFADLDLSRTVGWFSTHFPLRLEIAADAGAADVGGDLKRVKERLRQVPDRGIGYGLLRYLTPGTGELEARLRALRQLPEPEVKFNYLGQFDQLLALPGAPLPSALPRGADRSRRSRRPRRVGIDAGIAGGRLHLRFSHGTEPGDAALVGAFAATVHEELLAILRHCRSPEAGGCTPADFPLAGLAPDRLDALVAGLTLPAGAPPGRPHGVQLADIYPLSPLQKSLLLHGLAMPASTAGFEQKSSTLAGGFDAALFERCWQRLVDRHAILRTAFVWDGLDEPLQVVFRQLAVPLERLDWRGVPAAELPARLRALLAADRERGFDPARAPLTRLVLVELPADQVQFVWSYSHLLLDAWSRTLILRELFATYEALRRGEEPRLPPAPEYRGYIAWLAAQDGGAARDFWRQTLAGWSAPTPLWIDRLAPPRPEGGYGCRTLELDGPASARLHAAARRHQWTLNTVLLGAWAVLLRRYSGRRDVLFGATAAGRPAALPEVESMLGLFINHLPVRVEVADSQPIAPWLERLQGFLAAVRDHEWCAPDQIQEWAGLAVGRRLFDSLVLVQNYQVDSLPAAPEAGAGDAAGRLAVLALESRLEVDYPVTLVAGPLDPLNLRLFHDGRRIEEAAADRLLGHLASLLDGVAAAPEAALGSLSLWRPAERGQLLAAAAPAASGPAVRMCVHHRFEARVHAAPRAPALRWEGGQLSAGELNGRANALARALLRRGLGAGSTVLLWSREPVDLALGALAVLKAGGAFAAVDPRGPAAELELALGQLCPAAVVTRADLLAGLPAALAALPAVCVDDRGLAALSAVDPETGGTVADVALRWPVAAAPAAVAVTHRTFAAQAAAWRALLGLAPEDLVVVATGPAPRLAVDLVLALAGGLQVAALASDLTGEPQLLAAARKRTWRKAVRAVVAHPAALCALADVGGDRRQLRLFASGGPLAHGLARELQAAGTVTLLYAPRPAPFAVALGEPRDDGGALVLDRLLGEAGVRVLDGLLQPVPPGIPGTIHIESAAADGGPLATADAGRLLPAGGIELLGRTAAAAAPAGDAAGAASPPPAVDAAGVPLGVVEAMLRRHPAVREAAVVLARIHGREACLVAYVALTADREATAAELGGFLLELLPRHMVPMSFAFLAALPLGWDGLTDLAALPPPEDGRLRRAYAPPRDPLEQMLVDLWEEVFGVRPVGIRDNFFELGGNSLLAARLLAALPDHYRRRLPLTALVRAASVETLADLLRRRPGAEAWSPLVPLVTGDGRLPPLFCIHPLSGEVFCYRDLTAALGRERTIFGLQARAWEEDLEPHATIEEMAASYAAAIVAANPAGPYLLAGWSFGGLVALAVAQHLRTAGREVSLLAILDTRLARETAPSARRDRFARFQHDHRHLPFEEQWQQARQDPELGPELAQVMRDFRLPEGIDLEMVRRYRRLGEAFGAIRAGYQPRPYDGRIVLFRAGAGHVLHTADPTLGWGAVAAGGLAIEEVPGNHDDLVYRPHALELAKKLHICMRDIQPAGLHGVTPVEEDHVRQSLA